MTSSLASRMLSVDRYVWWGAALTAGAVYLHRVDPRSLSFLHCPFHAVTGLACPGCGTLRAAHSLLHGEIVSALQLNPLMVLGLPFLMLMFGERLARYWPPGRPRDWQFTRKIAPLVPWIVGVYWLLRNLPFHPFTLFSP